MIDAICQWCLTSDAILAVLAVAGGAATPGCGKPARRFRGATDGRVAPALHTRPYGRRKACALHAAIGNDVPYHVTWAHEVVLEHDGEFAELTSIRGLVDWLDT